MERKTSLFSFFALAKASSPQGNQSTGLWACCSRYGLISRARRLALPLAGGALSSAAASGTARKTKVSKVRQRRFNIDEIPVNEKLSVIRCQLSVTSKA